MLRFCCLAVAVLAVASAEAGDINPYHYNLLYDFTGKEPSEFIGSVEIYANTNAIPPRTYSFLLNATDLTVNETDVLVIEQGSIPKELSYKDWIGVKDGVLKLTFTTPLIANAPYLISIKFKGKFDQNGINSQGDIIYTNFFPQYAKKGFPCFDTADVMRSTFDLEIIHTKDWTAYSYTKNSSRSSTNPVQTVFSTSPNMPISSLGFSVVRNYKEYKGDPISPGVVLLAPSAINVPSSVFLLKCATLDPFKDLYSLTEKSDLYIVSVPYASQGVSNSRNMIFMESSYFELDAEMTTKNKADYCLFILKSVATNFYGMVIPPTNWNQQFIYQSIPYYLQMHAFGQMKGMWDEKFIEDIKIQHFEMGFQEGNAIQPSFDSVEQPKSIQFSSPSAIKGASFLTMMDIWLSYKSNCNIYDLLVSFFKEKLDSDSVQTTDFLESISKKSSISVQDLEDWLKAENYPVLSVNLNGKNVSIKVKGNDKWSVPVTYQVEGMPTVNTLLKKGASIELSGVSGWIIVNVMGTGLYRVDYDDELWTSLASNMDSYKEVWLRTRLFSDAFWVVRESYKDGGAQVRHYNTTLSVLEGITNERRYTPWSAALRGSYYLRNVYWKSDLKKNLEEKLQMLLTYTAFDLGFRQTSTTPDAMSDNMSRRLILSAYCDFGDPNCQTTLRNMFLQLQNNTAKAQYFGFDAVQSINCVGMGTYGSDNNKWTELQSKYGKTDQVFKKIRTFDQFACTTYVNKFLNKMIDDMTDEDILLAFDSLSSQSKNVEKTLEYFKGPIGKWKKRPDILGQVITTLSGRLYSNDQNILLGALEQKWGCTTTQVNTTYCKALADAIKTVNYTLTLQKDQLDPTKSWCGADPVPPVPPTPSPTPSPSSTSTSSSSTSSPSSSATSTSSPSTSSPSSSATSTSSPSTSSSSSSATSTSSTSTSSSGPSSSSVSSSSVSSSSSSSSSTSSSIPPSSDTDEPTDQPNQPTTEHSTTTGAGQLIVPLALIILSPVALQILH